MKKLYSTEKGVHYQYKGYTIFKDKSVDSERKYSYLKGEWSPTNKFGYARTLSLAKLWIDSAIQDEENKVMKEESNTTLDKAIEKVQARVDELEECAKFWLQESVSVKNTAVRRRECTHTYNQYVTRVVTAKQILNSIKELK